MKRAIFIIASLTAVPLFALTTNPQPGDRIGVLRMSGRFPYAAERTVAGTIQHDLRRELDLLGFKSFDAQLTYGELLRRGPQDDADYYVEVLSGDAAGRPVGVAEAGVGGVAVEVGVVVARVAAEVRVYDARSLNAIDTYDLRRDNMAVVPTGIGIAGHSIWAAITLPFIQYAQYRSAAHDVARQAALRIAGK
ncbi:MAG TPA: hypothetical protein VJ853_13025 [Thermoanaerobaculia bacterium]|nr:hypothetical protein [Thermoanaerobaculia bacterium]